MRQIAFLGLFGGVLIGLSLPKRSTNHAANIAN